MRVFISYSHEDKQIVKRISEDLRRQGVQAWLDEDLISPGEQWIDKLSEAFESSDAILVIMSRNTAESRWQTSEIALAVATQRKDPSKRIIPVLVDRQADVPFFLKDLVYCDLSSEDKYEQSFELLLHTLTKPPKVIMDMKETDRRKIAMIKVQKELHRHDVEMLDRRKLIWMSTVGVTVTVLAALATLLAFSVTAGVSIFVVFNKYGYFLAGVLLGITCSVVVHLVARVFYYRRTVRKEGEVAKAFCNRTALKEGEDAQR